MKLAVVAALRTELVPTLAALAASPDPSSHPKTFSSPPFRFAVAGIGAEKAAAAALALLRDGPSDGLISVGFCGAITGDLELADIVLGGTTRYDASPELLDLARAAWPQAKSGRIATVTRVINDPAERKSIAQKTGAIAVEMEADAVGRAAKEKGLGFLCVKVVIDTPAEPLASTYAGCWRVLLDVVMRPGTIGQMIYDSTRVKIAAGRLRDFFVAFRGKLPAS